MRWIAAVIVASLILLTQAARADPAQSTQPALPVQIRAAHSLYLSALFKAAGQQGIYGMVTIGGRPAKFVSLDLIIKDSQSWRLHEQTRTDFSGRYAFTQAATLAPGEAYFVRFLNSDNPDHLRIWESRMLTEYAAGEATNMGSFDIKAIEQLKPAAGETVWLPVTFTWEMCPEMPGSSYEFELADLDPEHEGSFYANVGAADQFTLEALPPNFLTGMMYYWCVWTYTPDGGRGASFYNLVIFSQAAGRELED